MKQKLFALFAVAALLLGMSACTTVDNPSSGGGNAQEDPVVAPAQLKQGIWTEYDEALQTSGKYTEEQLAQIPTVGMEIKGDKGYFFTYTAEEVSETVEGKISYDNKTGKGTITFPAIKDNPLSGQSVSFSMTTDETMEFEFTYEGKKTTGTCVWLCENLDNWSSDITDEDWLALMKDYETIAKEAGPDASIDWGDYAEPLPWEDEVAAARAVTRSEGSSVSTIGSVFSSLFKDDPLASINDKLDELSDKVDQVLENQKIMIAKLNEINERLIAIANTLNQQEVVNIFNNRNSTYYNPLHQQNVAYFDDAYALYKQNKGKLSQENKDKLRDYAKAWVGDGKKYVDLTWQYMKYLTTVQQTKYGTGMDKIYDGLTFDKYPWEYMGIGDRQSYRAYDLTMIAKSLFMISLYAQYGGLSDIEKEGLYKIYKDYMPAFLAFSEFNVSDPKKFLVCQIPGAHFVMHKEIQEYYYGGQGDEAPDPRGYGKDANFMPRWHSAGKIIISNPQELRRKLIPRSKMNAICNYFGNNRTWYYMLMESHQNAKGAVTTHKPSDDSAILMLYNNEQEDKNGVNWYYGASFGVIVQMFNIMQKNKTEEYTVIGVLDEDKDNHKWLLYEGTKQFYAAIVEKHF